MHAHFSDIANVVQQAAKRGEVLLLWYSGEQSSFIRFNQAMVRQATEVTQISATLSLIAGQQRATLGINLTGNVSDRELVQREIARLREVVADVPADPYLLYSENVNSTEHVSKGSLPGAATVIDAVTSLAAGQDLVGFYQGGPMFRGFANSLGQRNWHQSESFNFDWCLYHEKDKAVKTGYAGNAWNTAEFESRLRFAGEQLQRLKQPAMSLKPGAYRACFSANAANELLRTAAWGGFSQKSRATQQSTLQKLYDGELALSPQITLAEAINDGVAPGFQSEGFVRPARVPLIEKGRAANTLVSPRSAKEYGLDTNGAGTWEMPDSLSLSAGDVQRDKLLAKLDTGLYIGNLWYLNYSDRQNCRMTGMTRFACFWVENGELKAPINVMRFDDSIYRMFGDNLVGLGSEAELILDADCYGERSSVATRTPAVVVDEFRLTL